MEKTDGSGSAKNECGSTALQVIMYISFSSLLRLRQEVHLEIQAKASHSHPLPDEDLHLWHLSPGLPAQGPPEEPREGARPGQDGVRLRLRGLRAQLQLPVQLQEAPGHALGRGGPAGLQDMQGGPPQPGQLLLLNGSVGADGEMVPASLLRYRYRYLPVII